MGRSRHHGITRGGRPSPEQGIPFLRLDRVHWRDRFLFLSYGGSMPKYVIEREVPGAGKMSPEQLQAISQTSCGVLRKLGPEIQWVHSYVTGDKIYCIYNAANEQLVR